MKAVICLAGGIATGKTTLAQTLADRWPNSSVRSFGEVVRAHAHAEGLPTDRASLQQVGLRLIDQGWPTFCQHLLGDLPAPCDVLIIDGIRHSEPVRELRRRFPTTPVRVILLRPPPAVIAQRLRQRGEPDEVRHHTVESATGALATVADLIVDSTRPVAEIADEIQQLASERPGGPGTATVRVKVIPVLVLVGGSGWQRPPLNPKRCNWPTMLIIVYSITGYQCRS